MGKNHNTTPYVETKAIPEHMLHDVWDDRIHCSECGRLIRIKDSDTIQKDNHGNIEFSICVPCRVRKAVG